MIVVSAPSVSDHLSLEDAVTRLKASSRVDGIAEFGSRTTSQANVASDYDLLVLVRDLPTEVFQMVTTIGGRLADIVLVETKTADTLLATSQPPKAGSFEALFALKMRTARIMDDASGRLGRIRQLVTNPAWAEHFAHRQSDAELYSAWFWNSFGLLHLERMSKSQDPAHLSAVDMMLTGCLPGTWRSYFAIRGIPWEGEKAAIRYWAQHDPGYSQAVRKCLEMNDRNERLTAYRELVEQTLRPIGKALKRGETAAILANSANNHADVQRVLRYWNSLFGP